MSASLAFDEPMDVNELVDKFATILRSRLAKPAEAAQPTAKPDGRRAERRRRVLMSGKITGANRHASIDCAIRDMSTNGACVRLDGLHQLPEQFQLFVQRDGLYREARVVWQKNHLAGITFSGWEQKIDDTDFSDRNSVLKLVKSMGVARN